MYYLIDVAEFKTQRKKKKPRYVEAATSGAATAYLGQQTVRSSVPRLLGVRLESHSTSKDSAKKILKAGGVLDPSYGGTGAAKAINDLDYIEQSKNYVHITGYHPDTKVPIPNSASPIYKKLQRAMYRGLVGETIDPDNPKQVLGAIVKGHLGIKGKSLYIGGTDDYFHKNFVPDADDLALKTDKAIKVYSNRFKATTAAIKEHGLTNLIKANPKRVVGGAAILGAGTLLTAAKGKQTIDALKGVERKPRKEIITVKSSIRKGKVVKGYKRKNTVRNK